MAAPPPPFLPGPPAPYPQAPYYPPAPAPAPAPYGYAPPPGFPAAGLPPPPMVIPAGPTAPPPPGQISQPSLVNGIGIQPETTDQALANQAQLHVDPASQELQLEQVGPLTLGAGARRDVPAFTLPKLSSRQREDIERAKKYATEQSIKTVLIKQTISHQQQQMMNFQTTVQKQQALALMCRIYVGSISFDIKEEMVHNTFSVFGPIKSVSMSFDPITNHHKGFAFVDFEIPESAFLSMEQMNNVLMSGRNIKVGRPSNMPQAQPIIEQLAHEAATFNRIFVASIHPDLTESDLQSVFEVFGPIKGIDLIMDQNKLGKNRGIAFINYGTAQAAADAVANMNLLDLGGQHLRVGKAVTPPSALQLPTVTPKQSAQGTLPTAAAVAAATITAQIAALEATGGASPGGAASPAAHQSSDSKPASRASSVPPVAAAAAAAAAGRVPAAASPVPVAPVPTAVPGAPGAAVPIPPPAALPATTSGFAPQMPTPVTAAAVAPAPLMHEPVMHRLPQPGGRGSSKAGGGGGGGGKAPQRHHLLPEDAPATLAQQENLTVSGSDARHLVMQKLMRQSECRVMVLRNMVGAEDVDEELESEVTDECNKYGQVERVIIYQERQGDRPDAEVIVKIFVEFTSEREVELAAQQLNGRFFAGRTIRAEKYDQQLFDAKDLTG